MIIEHNCVTNKAIYTSLWITFGHNFDTFGTRDCTHHNFDTIELWQK